MIHVSNFSFDEFWILFGSLFILSLYLSILQIFHLLMDNIQINIIIPKEDWRQWGSGIFLLYQKMLDVIYRDLKVFGWYLMHYPRTQCFFSTMHLFVCFESRSYQEPLKQVVQWAFSRLVKISRLRSVWHISCFFERSKCSRVIKLF